MRPQRSAGRLRLVACVAGVSLAAGCAGLGPVVDTAAGASARSVELSDTPFFPQQRHQCGPAALATLLKYSGVEITAQDLSPEIYIPERRGTLQVELVAASRRHQRIPYVLRPTVQHLLGELHAGRPVLVLQRLGAGPWPIWHYAVLFGYSGDRNSFVLRSGTNERVAVPAGRFLQTWNGAGSWAMVVLRPGELPAAPERGAYLQAVAAMEGVAAPDTLLAAFGAALSEWPDDSIAYFGLANALQAQGRMAAATAAYRQILADQPRHVPALNNLSLALAAQGCHLEAHSALQRALTITPPPNPLRMQLMTTGTEIRKTARSHRPANRCVY